MSFFSSPVPKVWLVWSMWRFMTGDSTCEACLWTCPAPPVLGAAPSPGTAWWSRTRSAAAPACVLCRKVSSASPPSAPAKSYTHTHTHRTNEFRAHGEGNKLATWGLCSAKLMYNGPRFLLTAMQHWLGHYEDGKTRSQNSVSMYGCGVL